MTGRYAEHLANVGDSDTKRHKAASKEEKGYVRLLCMVCILIHLLFPCSSSCSCDVSASFTIGCANGHFSAIPDWQRWVIIGLYFRHSSPQMY